MGLFGKKSTTVQSAEFYEREIDRILTDEGPDSGAWKSLVKSAEKSREVDYLIQLKAGAGRVFTGPDEWATDPERIDYWVDDLVRRIDARLRVVRPRPPQPPAIVGVTFYQEAMQRIFDASGSISATTRPAKLVPEPDNPHDKNAVAVEVKGERIGHLKREDAAQYSPALRRLDKPLPCRVTIWPEETKDGERVFLAHFFEPLPSPGEIGR